MSRSIDKIEIKSLKDEDIAVVFSSCDKYKPIWESFFVLFDKYMPKANYHFYGTVADDYRFNEYFVKGNNYRKSDQSFSTRLLITLKRISSRYVLFFLDDFYLIGKVDQRLFINAFNVLKADTKVKNIILKDFIKTSTRCDSDYNEMFSVVKRNAPFRCTTQISIFDRKYLISLLRRGETAWEFEFYASYRARFKNRKILYRKDDFHNDIPYYDAGYLRKGKFNPVYTEFAEKNNLTKFDFTSTQDRNDIAKNEKKSLISHFVSAIKIMIHNIHDNLYPILSCFFRVKKLIKGSIPKYIRKMNTFEKEDAIK